MIYLLDADWYHDGSSTMIGDGGVAGIASALSEGGRIPKVIVIGIGYVKKNQRGRDLLWAHEKFYAFLTEELVPFVDGEYRTDTAAPRTLVGHSDGGYFALYAFFQSGGNEDAPFRQFVAISGDLTKNEWLPFREEGAMHRRIGDSGRVGGGLVSGGRCAGRTQVCDQHAGHGPAPGGQAVPGLEVQQQALPVGRSHECCDAGCLGWLAVGF